MMIKHSLAMENEVFGEVLEHVGLGRVSMLLWEQQCWFLYVMSVAAIMGSQWWRNTHNGIYNVSIGRPAT